MPSQLGGQTDPPVDTQHYGRISPSLDPRHVHPRAGTARPCRLVWSHSFRWAISWRGSSRSALRNRSIVRDFMSHAIRVARSCLPGISREPHRQGPPTAHQGLHGRCTRTANLGRIYRTPILLTVRGRPCGRTAATVHAQLMHSRLGRAQGLRSVTGVECMHAVGAGYSREAWTAGSVQWGGWLGGPPARGWPAAQGGKRLRSPPTQLVRARMTVA